MPFLLISQRGCQTTKESFLLLLSFCTQASKELLEAFERLSDSLAGGFLIINFFWLSRHTYYKTTRGPLNILGHGLCSSSLPNEVKHDLWGRGQWGGEN